jgi:hypothetical protein
MKLKRFILLVLILPAISACGKVTLDVNISPNLSTSFVENITIDTLTSGFLAACSLSDEDDIWHRLKAFCEQHGFTYKLKSANHFRISGSYPAGHLNELGSLLSDEMLAVSSAYRTAWRSPPVRSEFSLTQSNGIFVDEYNMKADVDMSIPQLKEAAAQGFFREDMVRSAVLEVHVHTPFQVVSSNAERNQDQAAGQTWVIGTDKPKTLNARYRSLNTKNIAIAAIGLALVLAVGLLAVLSSKKARRSAKEPDSGT